MKNTFFVICLFICFCCCKKEADIKKDSVELRSNFSETEFKNALIGEWRSVFEDTEYENVIYLKFDDQNKSTIILKKDDIEKEYSGNYVISFIKEPAKGNITIAKIIISSSKREIELSGVYFSEHNASSVGSGLFLEEPPYGVLEGVKQ
jgi:hypothetical protein